GPVADRGRVAGQGVDARDDGGRGTGAADLHPAVRALVEAEREQDVAPGRAAAVVGGVVDGHAGTGVGDGGDVGDRTVRTAGVLLPTRLRLLAGAAGTRLRPRRLGPTPAAGAGLAEAGAAHRGHVRGRGRPGDAVTGVAGAGGDGHAGVVEVRVVGGEDRAGLRAAPAVGDGDDAGGAGGGVLRRVQV